MAKITRRDFLKLSAWLGAAVAVGIRPEPGIPTVTWAEKVESSPKQVADDVYECTAVPAQEQLDDKVALYIDGQRIAADVVSWSATVPAPPLEDFNSGIWRFSDGKGVDIELELDGVLGSLECGTAYQHEFELANVPTYAYVRGYKSSQPINVREYKWTGTIDTAFFQESKSWLYIHAGQLVETVELV